ncbi:MAG: DUF6291 domain-containing protein, partial [Bacteroidales bacterium]|nr:DUF6291 domain-containing protein [Bacteroidales bacterium]
NISGIGGRKRMKNTFIMYTEWSDMLDELTDDELGEVLRAIMCYQSGKEIPELSHCAKAVFAQIRTQFRKDDQKYAETSEKRREASLKGVEARKQKQPNGNQTLPHGQKNNQTVGDSDSDSVSDSDSESVSENHKKESDLKVTRERFKPPTVDEVREYAAERGYTVDAERFVDYYQTNGWMAGKNHMKDWKAAVRNWDRNNKERQGMTAKPNNSYIDAIENRVKVVDDWI